LEKNPKLSLKLPKKIKKESNLPILTSTSILDKVVLSKKVVPIINLNIALDTSKIPQKGIKGFTSSKNRKYDNDLRIFHTNR